MLERTNSKRALADSSIVNATIEIELSKQISARSWNIDLIDMNARTGGHVLSLVAKVLFDKRDLFKTLKIDPVVARNFFGEVESRYKPVPYHCASHGAEVAYSFYHLLVTSRQLQSLESLEVMSALIACLGHDIGHPGFNNAFMVATSSDVALLYNDMSVLENFHIAELFRVMSLPKHNILASLSKTQYRVARQIIIDVIMATDLGRHFDVLSSVRAKIALAPPGDEATVVNFFEKDVTLMLKLVVKLADLSHFAKDHEIHMKWNSLLLEEFYAQGDQERTLGLQVSPLMDRNEREYCLGKNQNAFIDLIVRPLYECANVVLFGMTPIVSELNSTVAYWARYVDRPKSLGLGGEPPPKLTRDGSNI
ncbi:hypothetical protein PBRA_008610 [Plasmodiophora brassicae]|nr:hypothetical protein PBRA_008610 [Plasmodiophora brassicae]